MREELTKHKVKIEQQKDGKTYGCILDENDPRGDAVCFVEGEGIERISGTFKTIEDESTIRTIPMTSITGTQSQVEKMDLHDFVADNLPIWQRQLESKRRRGLGSEVVDKLKNMVGGD
ncbi:hypothetical protein DRQ25_00430 [Candidatus Fermentibacteria bacterium]|nr:MAG: hypothetical protein DRQ25_00430 [Candidatus Fermentibacteria bacterium]